VIVLFQAPLRYGSLEVEKTSSRSKPYTALMRVVKRKEVESFFTSYRNVSEGKQDGIRLTWFCYQDAPDIQWYKKCYCYYKL